jgi:hypothetical protein
MAGSEGVIRFHAEHRREALPAALEPLAAELAFEVARLGATGVLACGVLGIGGHEDGVLAFGTTPAQAGRRQLEALERARARGGKEQDR